MARDGRVVQLVDGGPEAVAAAAIGGASAGFRVVTVRLAEREDDRTGVVELVPPGAAAAARPADPRERRPLDPVPGGAGDPDIVPGPGLFAPPERFDQRPFSAAEAARVVTDVAVETLKARGEPARYERLFGEVLVGLDRSGQLRRLAAGWRPTADDGPDGGQRGDTSLPDPSVLPDHGPVRRGRHVGRRRR